jgi:hypothetical protein
MRNNAQEQAQIAQEAENRRQQEAQAEAERIRQAEVRRQENITQGANEISNVFGQFNDDFFNARSQDYMNYAMPQLDREYQDEQRQLIASLARSGNLNSSLRGDMMGRLLGQYNTRKTGLQDTANRYASDARSQVERARAELLQSNASLADPGTVRTMAQARATGVSAPAQYQSLGDMIASLSNSVAAAPATAGPTTGGGIELYDPTRAGSGSGRLVS